MSFGAGRSSVGEGAREPVQDFAPFPRWDFLQDRRAKKSADQVWDKFETLENKMIKPEKCS